MKEQGPRVVLYNPRAVFYTMPLALVALASALDRAKFEVVIVDGRLEARSRRRVVAAAERRAVPRRHGADRRADPRRARRLARRQGAGTSKCASSGAAGIRRCSR